MVDPLSLEYRPVDWVEEPRVDSGQLILEEFHLELVLLLVPKLVNRGLEAVLYLFE